MTLRVLVVDDEAPARRRLRRLIDELGGAQMVGEAEGGLEAIDAARTLRPDVVLLDVQMPELDGIAVAQALAGCSAYPPVASLAAGRIPCVPPRSLAARPAPSSLLRAAAPRGAMLGPGTPCSPLATRGPAIVFVTAHDAYAVKAFEVSAVDYLLKPVAAPRLRQALERVGRPDAQQLAALAPTRRWLERLFVEERGRIFPVALADVERIVAERNYVRLCSAERELLHRTTITALAAVLDPERFARISRSAIVRVDAIRELVPLGHGDHQVHMRSGVTLRWSRMFRPNFV